MFRISESLLLLSRLCVFYLTAGLAPAHAATFTQPPPRSDAPWNAVQARLITGLPGLKPGVKGSLDLSSASLIFNSTSGTVSVPLASIVAAETGNQRVELWGTKGRLLRMAIPNGGGILFATVLHHRVDMLTVEFEDQRSGYHAAVFALDSDSARRALGVLSTAPAGPRQRPVNSCPGAGIRPRTVRILQPAWNDVQVPAAYRALIYENLVQRIGRVKGIDYVYRDGESDPAGVCAAYTVALTATAFREGSQVQRASTGPVGMFLGTTQLKFDLRISPAGGPEHTEEARATVRGETESLKVSDSVARKTAKALQRTLKTNGGA